MSALSEIREAIQGIAYLFFNCTKPFDVKLPTHHV